MPAQDTAPQAPPQKQIPDILPFSFDQRNTHIVCAGPHLARLISATNRSYLLVCCYHWALSKGALDLPACEDGQSPAAE